MRRTIRLVLCSISLLPLVPSPAHAQVQTGTPPFGSFGGGPDIINLANLNSHLCVPVLHKPGRGTDFDYDLCYDSSVWYPVTSGSTTTWQPTNASNGWTASLPYGGSASPSTSSTSYYTYCGPNNVPKYAYITTYTYSHWVYTDQRGTAHPYPSRDTSSMVSNGCTGDDIPSSFADVTSDGSGYTVSVTGSTVNSLYASDGALINPYSGAVTLTDRNGNQITSSNSSGTTSYYDTLSSTTPVLTVAGSGTPSSPTTFKFTAPNLQPAYYTMSYITRTVKTNFGCSGITEYGPISNNLVDRVTLPDGSFYQFNYEQTPGFSGDYTGRLASVILPTGGTITYTYTGGSSGHITCSDGSASGYTRQTPDGTWTYTRIIGTGAASTTTVTDPQNNQTKIQFQGIYETQRDIYQGSAISTNLLRTLNTCYNAATPPCNNAAITLPITTRTVLDQYAGSLPAQCKHVFTFSTFGVLTEQDDYDFGASGPGALLRKVIITIASLGSNINAFRQTTTICNSSGTDSACNGSGTVIAQTTNNYDENTPAATSGTPQHVAVSGSRGNLTSVVQFVKASPATNLTSHATYYDTGTLNTSTDVNGAVTTFNYSSASCGNSFPTSINEPLSMTRSMAWNCTGGVPPSVTDENGKVTSTTWTDPDFWRPAATNFPDGGQTSITYNSATSVASTTKMNSSQSIVSTVLLDGLGRTTQEQLYDPQGTDYVDTTYDSLGRVATVSNPHRSTSSYTDGSTTYGYDALSRTTSVTLQDGSVSGASYSGNTVTATDPAGKKRQSTYDSLGRLTQVVEDPGGLGYTSTYTYDALGNLTNVVQNGSRQRAFAYDGLSRLLCESNPEIQIATCPNPDNGAYTQGTIRYGYDASGHPGDLTSRTAPAPNQTGTATVTTTYAYDLLHRLTQKSYNDGATSAAHFLYDVPSQWGATITNVIGRLSEAYIDTCPPAGGNQVFSYDAQGRVILNMQSTPVNCGTGAFSLSYTYDLAGNMTSYTNGAGVTFTQSFDAVGRATQLTSSMTGAQFPATLATVDSAVGYYPVGVLGKITYGNGLTQASVFEARMQPCVMNVNSAGKGPADVGGCVGITNPPTGTLQQVGFAYGAWGSTNNGNVTTMIATGAQSYNRTYSYDQLNRISTMTDAATSQACKGLSWTYDAWGNRTDQTLTAGTCYTFHQTLNTQNRLVGPPYLYDAAGNLTADGSHTYTYDAENRLIKVDGGTTATYSYDALGRRVEKSTSGGKIDYLYDLAGNVETEEYNNFQGYTGWGVGYVYFNGSPVAEYRNSTTYFIHGDHLGSSRLVTGVNQAIVQNLDYLPFGELNSTDSGISTHKFTGDERDAETSFDHTQFRQYTSQLARWITPDPAGLAAVDPTNPQSWNRYAYVLNNPMNLVDPTGLGSCEHMLFDDASCFGGQGPIVFGDDGGDGWGYCPPEFQTCYPPVDGIGIGIDFGGGGGGSPSAPAPQPSPIAPSAPQIANTCQVTGTCSTDIVCQYGFCSAGPQFGQGFIGADTIAESALCVLAPELCIAIRVTAGAILVIEAIRLIHLSQHGRGEHSDTGIMNDVYQLIRAGAAAGVCTALDLLAKAANAVGDTARLQKIKKTQKAQGCKPSRETR